MSIMNFTSILMFIMSLLCSCSESIYNGNFVSIKGAPYHVLIIDYKGIPFCGGAILSDYWAITAAHCIRNDIFGVTSGSSTMWQSGIYYKAEKIIVHGNFDKESKTSDIALIKLIKPITFNEYQQPIPISSNSLKSGDKVIVTGYGHQGGGVTFSFALKITELQVIDQDACKKIFAPVHGSIWNDNFCSGDRQSNVCAGDSGGPLVKDGKLVGIVSTGPALCKIDEFKDYPGVNTRVHYYYNWILKHTGINPEDYSTTQ